VALFARFSGPPTQAFPEAFRSGRPRHNEGFFDGDGRHGDRHFVERSSIWSKKRRQIEKSKNSVHFFFVTMFFSGNPSLAI
jgi:hypothetical protein